MLDLSIVICLIAAGFFIGVLSGFFGLGGGFILTPFLISLGLPANIAVGTSVTEIFMSSIIASLRHKRLGNIEMRVGLITALFSVIGTELGAQVIEQLKKVNVQRMDSIVSLIYILILTLISTYMIRESLVSRRVKDIKKKTLWPKVRRLKIPPLIIPQSSTEPISVWIMAAIGFISGLLAGFLGVGGGLILVPLLIYIVGCKPSIAAGTCIFGILVSCAYASLTHTLKGNVNFILAILIFIGSSIGVQIGALATKCVEEAVFKLAFGICLGLVSLSVIAKLISSLYEILIFAILSQVIMFLTLLLTSSLIISLYAYRAVKSLR